MERVWTMNELEVPEFSLKDTLECGQTFCWIPEGKGYINADIGQVVYVEQEGDILRWQSSDADVNIQQMLGLDHPIEKIKAEISKDSFIRKSIAFAPGLRIVRDSPYPCLVSFLCATWKNIPAIHTMIRRIRSSCGPTYSMFGKTFHGMPSPEQMCEFDTAFLRSLGLAWRAEFIRKSTEMILEGEVELEQLSKLQYEKAHEKLKTLHGVGNKVADCVALFSLGHLEAFPIDVWIERIIQENYDLFTESGNSYRAKSNAARAYFGRYAGYAQEYLYNFTRRQSVKQ